MTTPSTTTPQRASAIAIGAVGHRTLPSSNNDLEAAIRDALAALLDRHDTIELLVSLAEGADRLIVDAATTLGIPYIAVLPFEPERFERDFHSPESVTEYWRLLAGAREIARPENEPVDREHGYVWANRYIIERADLLLAVWNGQPANGPGGTADAIQSASEHGVPVLWIPVQPPHRPVTVQPLALDRN